MGDGGVDLVGVEQVELVKVLCLLLEHHEIGLAYAGGQHRVHLQIKDDLLLDLLLLENVLVVLSPSNNILELIQVIPQGLLNILILDLVIRLA